MYILVSKSSKNPLLLISRARKHENHAWNCKNSNTSQEKQQMLGLLILTIIWRSMHGRLDIVGPVLIPFRSVKDGSCALRSCAATTRCRVFHIFQPPFMCYFKLLFHSALDLMGSIGVSHIGEVGRKYWKSWASERPRDHHHCQRRKNWVGSAMMRERENETCIRTYRQGPTYERDDNNLVGMTTMLEMTTKQSTCRSKKQRAPWLVAWRWRIGLRFPFQRFFSFSSLYIYI